MNRDEMKGKWTQLKGEIKKQWGKLTDDDLTKIDGEYDKLIGRLQAHYGYTRAEAQREVDHYLERQVAHDTVKVA